MKNQKLSNLERAQLTSQIKRLNQRIVEIERGKGENKALPYKSYRAYSYIDKLSKASATSKYFGTTKKGGLKFTTSISKMSDSELKEYKTILQGFEQAKTSTIKGIKEVQKKQAERYKEVAKQKGIPLPEGVDFDDIAEAWKAWKDANKATILSSDQVTDIIHKYYDPEHPDYFNDMINDPTFKNKEFSDIMDMPTFEEWDKSNRHKITKKGRKVATPPLKKHSKLYRK